MSENKTTDRRSFLKMASLGAASSIAVATGVQSASADETSQKASGYSETDHVRKVYELAKF